jgi:membrane-bound serine protease (ClpP class)
MSPETLQASTNAAGKDIMEKRHLVKKISAFALLLFITFAMVNPVFAQSENRVVVLALKGPLTPAMAEYLERGIRWAETNEVEAIVLKLDTPGGEITLMNRMVQSIRASAVPVIVFVEPRGAIAGSAGMMIVLAGHAAAMAPETAIGAASPIGGQGEDLGETIEAKQKEIMKATIRSLAAGRRETAIALAEAAIDEAKAASSVEALSVGMIDTIVDNTDEVFHALDGFQVQLPTGERILDFESVSTLEFNPSLIEEILQTLTNPNIVFILLTIGVQAILIEISSPGGWVAGFVGVVALALGGYGLGVLPVNWFGVIFLVTSFVLFVLDIKAPTHGALTVAGLGSFVIGALVLFNSPGTPDFQRVSVPLVIGAGGVTASLFFILLTFVIRGQRRKVEVGREALIGKIGRASTNLDPSGTVQVAGELWSAQVKDTSIRAGDQVEIIGMDGLRLLVKPVNHHAG